MSEKQKGVWFGISAYVLWGIIPIYWKFIHNVSSLDILCYRVIWSFVFVLIYILVFGKGRTFYQEFQQFKQEPKKIFLLLLASILISINWFTFIYSVNNGRVTDASLGYYMNPLVNVLLGTVFLKERLSRTGMIACGMAVMGVLLLVIQTGVVPIASLIMAFTFGFYGLIKKGIQLSSFTSLAIETFFVLPVALIYLLGFSTHAFMAFGTTTNLLLMGAGVVTAIPLLLFAESAKRIPYIVLGFIQYINPTLMLLFAVFLFHEPYSNGQFFAFSFIWLGIAIFLYGNLTASRREKKYLEQNRENP